MLLAACVAAGLRTLYSEDLGPGAEYESVSVINPFLYPCVPLSCLARFAVPAHLSDKTVANEADRWELEVSSPKVREGVVAACADDGPRRIARRSPLFPLRNQAESWSPKKVPRRPVGTLRDVVPHAASNEPRGRPLGQQSTRPQVLRL